MREELTHSILSPQRAHFTVQDLSLLEVLKVGQLGRIYRAKITRGNCRGHRLVTCKLTMRSEYSPAPLSLITRV